MKKSLLLCIIAAIGFGVAPTFIQLAIQSGVSQTSCVLFNNILLMLVCLVMCLAGHHSLCIPAKKVLPLLLMGACGMGFIPYSCSLSATSTSQWAPPPLSIFCIRPLLR